MMRYLLVLFLFLVLSFEVRATHAMGGEITYRCVGNNRFVFELIFFRDCNGAEVNTMSENLKVWNHPTITSINMPFVSREDISPFCSPVSGSPNPLACGSGSAGGNGTGAIERVRYRSLPTLLSGVPPIEGWIFTFENFSRSGAITNITNPSAYGITLSAKMFKIPGSNGTECSDSSPLFLQEPNFVSCAGSQYIYNMNAVDPDLDSLHFSFGTPYDHFPGGTVYDPPLSPAALVFEPGFSFSSPTPDGSMNPLNIAATVNPVTGELRFTSHNVGNYVVKLTVRSFRLGVLISEVEREMQLVVTPCSPTNNAPTIQAPFPGNSWETTVMGGDLVNFNLLVNDSDLLQNGTPQSVYLSASGPMFGANFTSATGCSVEPCAFMSGPNPISGSPSINPTFTWQTGCDHLVNEFGIVAEVLPYNFVFKVQDDFCQVPRVTYATVKINVVNPGILPGTQIRCIQTDVNGDVLVTWNPIENPTGSFVAYEIRSLQNGVLATVPNNSIGNINLGPLTSARDIFVGVRSGCEGNVLKSSDTLSNIFLSVNNPGNGTAVLQWNRPRTQKLPSYGNFYHIYREFPAGTWTLHDSVPYNSPFYRDTIDICSAFLNYRIELPATPCPFTSNIAGDQFEDMLTPNIPVIQSVGADTATNQVRIIWNVNSRPDTYGYVIYTFDENNILYELDTVWGRFNTTYFHNIDPAEGPYTYSVAAFDSCLTDNFPVTYQTSAKGNLHTSMVSDAQVLMCEKQAIISWNPYTGRAVSSYRIWGKRGNTWEMLKATNSLTDTVDVLPGENYCMYVQAVFNANQSAFSSRICFDVPTPEAPAYHYFAVASIENKEVRLVDYIQSSVGISEIIYYRKGLQSNFEEIGRKPVDGDFTVFFDRNVRTNLEPLEYRTKYVDSCGVEGEFSQNINKTIFVSGTANEYDLVNTINWTPYEDFDGGIVAYRVFRGTNDVFDPVPIATVNNSTLSINDDISQLQTDGRVCYRVEALESINSFMFQEISRSNDFCLIYTPLVFIPNAFTPGGLNPIFQPVLSNVDNEGYTFSIMNRWGQIIFETKDFLEGWDGKIMQSGGDATSDNYLYIIEFQDQKGKRYVRRGFVALLR